MKNTHPAVHPHRHHQTTLVPEPDEQLVLVRQIGTGFEIGKVRSVAEQQRPFSDCQFHHAAPRTGLPDPLTQKHAFVIDSG